MSLLQSKRKSIKTRGVFAAILGQRLGGKSTIAGTLPGKSAMLTAKTFETGSATAEKLAANLGAELDVYEFTSAKDLAAMCKEAAETYDNIFIDGATGLTEILYRQSDITKALQKNSWDGFALLGDQVEDALLAIKDLTERDGGVNIFVTASVEPKYDQAGNVIELVIESKGKSVIKNLRKIFPVVVSLRPAYDENGHVLDEPEMVTKTDGVHSGRIDSLLAQDNPGLLPADLSALINLIKGA
jgi:hypothetical protein